MSQKAPGGSGYDVCTILAVDTSDLRRDDLDIFQIKPIGNPSFIAMALSGLGVIRNVVVGAPVAAIIPQRLLPAGYRFKKLIFVASSGPLYILNFGKYKRRELESVPSCYLRWIVKESPHRKRAYWAPLAQAVLAKRVKAEAAKYPPVVDHYGPYTPDQLDHMCRCGVQKRVCVERRNLRSDALFPPL